MSLYERMRSDWPFVAAKSPFYYGWVIAVVSTFGYLFSIPGQTMGMAVFSDQFIETFELERTTLSVAYLIGTLLSAFLLTRAGRWYDRHGARLLLVASPLLLATTLMLFSQVDVMAGWFARTFDVSMAWITFPMVLLCYFGVRFSGQGVLTNASQNLLMLWFEKRRGLVSGARGVFVSFGFSLAPLLIAGLILQVGWRGALWVMALAVALFAAFAFILVRNSPSVIGQQIDGRSVADQGNATSITHLSLAQARRTAGFWIYSLALSMHALFGTAVTFHVVAIFAEASRSAEEAFGYFFPQAVVSVMSNITASFFADRMKLKPLLVVMLSGFILGAWGLTQLENHVGYWALVIGFGIGGGLWGVLSNLAFVRQFGTRNLGEITGFNASLTVFASAIGPVVFSLARDWMGSFSFAAGVCMGVLVVLWCFACFLKQPRDHLPATN